MSVMTSYHWRVELPNTERALCNTPRMSENDGSISSATNEEKASRHGNGERYGVLTGYLDDGSRWRSRRERARLRRRRLSDPVRILLCVALELR